MSNPVTAAAPPAPATPEVRACPKCHQPAVVLVFEWKHTTYGIATGARTGEYRCQNCGAKFRVRPKTDQIAWWVVGVILTLSTVIFGIPFLILAWRRSTLEKRIPVVPGAPLPPMRFTGGPPQRTCGTCGGVARVFKVTRNTHNGIPTGTEYDYRCAGCQKQFTIESVGGQIWATFAAVVVGGIGAAFFVGADHPGWRYGGSIVATLIAVLVLVQVVRRLVARRTNPVIRATAPGAGGIEPH